jgi:multiple sugar transport system substrate-binding protein
MVAIKRRDFLYGASASGLIGLSPSRGRTQELSKKYAGTTLNILTRATPAFEATIQIGPEFTEATGIKLQYTRVAPGDQYQKLMLDLTSGTQSFDVSLFVYQWKYEIAPYLADLSMLEKDVPGAPPLALDDYPSKLVEIYGKVDNRLIGLPILGDVAFILWNKDAYKSQGFDPEAGPKSWQDLAERGKKLTTGKQFGYGLPAGKAIQCAVTWTLLYYGFGGRFFDKTGRPDLGGEAGIKTMQFMANELQPIAPPGNLAWDYNEMLGGFLTGQTAQTLMWPGGFANLSDTTKSAVAGKYGMTPPPGGALLGGTSIGIPAKARNPEAARLYVAWITSAAVAKKTALGGTPPARISLLKDPELVQRHPHYPTVLAALTGDTFGYIPMKEAEQVHIMMYDEANAACAKLKSPEQAAADLQSKAVAFMTRRGYLR